MRRFLLAATLFALIGLTAAVADDVQAPRVKAAAPKPLPGGLVETGRSAAAALEEELELLAAQRQAKAGYRTAAELALKEADRKLAEVKAEEDVDETALGAAKQAVEAAKAQLEIRTGELSEVEVRIKHTRQRLDQVKALVVERATATIVQAAGTAVMRAGGAGGVLLATGLELQPPAAGPKAGTKIAVFNMAAVMKEFALAKYQVYLLSEDRKTLSVELTNLKAQHAKLSAEVAAERNPAVKEDKQQQLVELGREYEDKSRKTDKLLNEKASQVIVALYDDIKLIVDEMALEKGYEVVFAYPDATGPDEFSPYVKELRLKPPAAQPFYVARHVDTTHEIVQKLNARYPAPPLPFGYVPPPRSAERRVGEECRSRWAPHH